MRLLTLLLLLLLVPTALAADTELYDYDEMTLELRLENTVRLVEAGPRPQADFLEATLSWFPRETFRQRVTSIETRPTAQGNGEAYTYRWERDPAREYTFVLDAVIETSKMPRGVREKVDFPIASLPADIARYTEETELIDVNREIEEQALDLARGTDDLFEVVHSVADWVTTNIEYNLSTLTAEATKSSSWVMENRYGVCDELTGLFISMLRSLGIPARFVSGISYTNLEAFENPWGGHGWAEVYFPGTGWVPFDATYGTYGFVDATHIKLKDALDSQTRSVEFLMKARDLKLETQRMSIDVEALDKRKQEARLYEVELEPYDDEVALDSYNQVTATIHNRVESYLSVRLSLARTQGLELVGDYERNVLLRPGESETIHFLVSPDNPKRGFRYTYPIQLYAGQNQVASTSFVARNGEDEYARAIFDEPEEGPSYEEAHLECEGGGQHYLGEETSISCEFINDGSDTVWGVLLCIDDECEERDARPGEPETFEVTRTCATPGVKASIGRARNGLLLEEEVLRYECLDEARIRFANLTHPERLAHDERGEIRFTLERASDSIPQDVRVSVRHDNFDQEWQLEELDGPHEFRLGVSGALLDLDENTVRVSVRYNDVLGASDSVSGTFSIQPDSFSFADRWRIRLANAERWLLALF